MKFFAKYVFNHIKRQIDRNLLQDILKNKLIIMMPSIPPMETYHIGLQLEEYCIQSEKLKVPVIKVANDLYTDWRSSNNADFQYYCDKIEKNNWNDTKGNLTSYRNLTNIENKLLVILLIGVDKITDSSSLVDFHHCDFNSIWNDLNHCFESWIEKKFNDSVMGYEEETVKNFDDILKAIAEKGLADILQVSEFLENLNLENAQDGKDAEQILLQSLDYFKLPLFKGYDFISSKSFDSYIDDAISFYSYTMFLEERSRKKIIKAINDFIEEKHEIIDDLIPREFYNPFNTVEEFIDGIKEYINTGNNELSDKLKRCDFVTMHRMLRYKKKTVPNGDKNNKEKIKKISGNPIEAILTAIWNTFSEYDVKGYKSIKEIQIKSELFKHDCSGNTTQEQHENAHEYISRLLGGIDFLVEKWIALEKDNTNKDKITVNCKLIHNQISYPSARSAEPFLKFSVTIIDENNESTVQKIFAWRLPEVHPYRISDEILQWAAQEIKTIQGCCLPVFNISYFDEMMLAKDEEEAHRVLMQCIEDEKNKLINLLDAPDIGVQTTFLEPINKLSIEYNKFLQKAAKEGIHNFFINGFDNLRQTYEQTFECFLNMDENNSLMNLLFRSFLIIQERKAFDIQAWEWEPYEKSGIVTILHPALLEMLRDQIFYLFSCFNYLVSNKLKSSIRNNFRESIWQGYVDLAKIQTPICGLISDKNMTLDTNVRGNNLVYRIGSIGKSETTLTTKLLLKYDEFDEESISDAEIFRQTRESNTYLYILRNYRKLHPHANDALTLAIYQNKDIQPIIAAIDQYLRDIFNNETSQRKYVLTFTVFSESSDDLNVSRWINQWKDCWETSEIQNSLSHYRNTIISISHRIIDSKNNYGQFRNIIKKDFEADIVFLSNFISAGEEGNDFQKVTPYDIRKHTLKFPMLEKSFCNINDPSKNLERARILSNRQFSLSTRFSELMARLKHKETLPGTCHVVLGFGDYSPWQVVIDDLHQHSEWVVCIDPSIDDTLIQKKLKGIDKNREIIGFVSGVGSHGENNYTISTEQYNFSDILRSLNESIKEVYTCWEDSPEEIAKSILKETKDLSGLSLIKATGTSHYIRDFMAYALTRKLLKVDEDVLCNKLIPLDAYQHWFETAENKSRTDLLWIIARMDGTNKIHLEFRLIECKLAQTSEGHINKARAQLQNGLQHLIPLFMPRHNDKNFEDDRPDQRYWWLQIHRLISSRTELKQQNMSKVLTALERLSEGDYSIQWQASAVTYWTDQKNSSIGITEKTRFAFEGEELDINSVAIGSDLVYSLCTSKVSVRIPWDEKSIKFDSAIQEEDIDVDKKIEGIESEEKPVLGGVTIIKPSKKEEEQEQIERDTKTDLESDTEVELVNKAQSIPERILLGEAIRGQKKIYWEYGHKGLSNRHMIIFGTSGMGKTYAIQCLLWELGKAGNNSLIVDYTNGFLDKRLELEIKTLLKPIQHIIRTHPLTINPFRRQLQNIGDETELESHINVAQRVSGVFSEVYNFGDQQQSALYQAIKLWLEFNKNKTMSLTDLIPQLRELQTQKGVTGSSASSVISKIQPFIDQNPFGSEDKESWDKLYNDIKNSCHIIQLDGFLKTSARLITEFVLIDLYWYYRWKGNQDTPRVLVLDEVQNLDHREESPLAQLLTEGRKFGFSLILATQIMSNLDKDERDRLFNAAHKLFFRPVDTEIRKYAEIASVFTNEKIDLWIRRLADLKKGQCYSLGPSFNEATGELEAKAFLILVTSLKDRK